MSISSRIYCLAVGEVIAEGAPEVVILDIGNPHFTALVKGANRVALITGAGTYENLSQAVTRGADGLVIKPFSHADLQSAVAAALDRRSPPACHQSSTCVSRRTVTPPPARRPSAHCGNDGGVLVEAHVGLQGRRLVEALLADGLAGSMQPAADNVFLLTPSGVQVSAEERRRFLEERGFFNQA